MSGRRSSPLPRCLGALLLGALLLAAQQLALLHPLSHLHDEAPATQAADIDCDQCLAGAAASTLATTGTAAAAALADGAVGVAGPAPCRQLARAPSTGHNRGPPARA